MPQLTPAEEAIELVEQFMPYSINIFTAEEQLWKAKEMALIVVNKILSIQVVKNGYWDSVKSEIIKL